MTEEVEFFNKLQSKTVSGCEMSETIEPLRECREKDFYEDVERLIAAYCLKRGCSQEKLAQSLGIPFKNLWKNEEGIKKVTLLNFVKICRILNIDFRYNGTFRVEPDELLWVEYRRSHNVKKVLEWLNEEIGNNQL